MPFPVSKRFIETLQGTDQKRISKAQIWNKNTLLVELGNVTAGSVSVDVTQPVRRTCTATIESQGLEFDDLVPTSARSLLHPASGNELRLFRGFEYLDGTQELCPLGVFRMTKPVVDDQGDSIVINVTGNDRSALISRRTWTDVYPIIAGTGIGQAIRNLIDNRVRVSGGPLGDLDLKYKFVTTGGLTVPATTFGTSPANSNDPWADAISLAVAGSFELFFDEEGAVVLQPYPTPNINKTAFPFAYAEGDNCTFTDVQRTLDETFSYNGVIAVGVGSGGPPLQAEVWDTNPTSPLYYRGPWGPQPYIYQTTLIPSMGQSAGSAQLQLLAMAQTIYRQVHTNLDLPSFSCIPNAALLESDTVDLVRERIGLNAPYVCGQMTIPLDISTLMTVTTRTPTITVPTPV